MSMIAYEPVASINAWSCSYCKSYNMQNIKAYNNKGGDLQWFTGYSSTIKGIVLSWRGSSNLNNWISNLSTNMVSYSKCSNCKVHSGFLNLWNSVKTTVMQNIEDLRQLHRDAPLYITGHSLGGALASLSAVDIHQVYGIIHSLYTFGKPRVGNKYFSDYYRSVCLIYRVTHYADIVPHLPTSVQGFLHEG